MTFTFFIPIWGLVLIGLASCLIIGLAVAGVYFIRFLKDFNLW